MQDAAHERIQETLHRLIDTFHIPGECALVQELVNSCKIYQWNKTKTLHPAGLLQPLMVASSVWLDISMDFIEALPCVHGKTVILSVISSLNMHTSYHWHICTLLSRWPELSLTVLFSSMGFHSPLYHSSLHDTPFKVVYGHDPPALPTYNKGEAKVESVGTALQ